jgi:2,4-dienoyl-CoA reductase-like NADH-dependent reductase (Old Yellow Enzyme family)
MYEHAGEFGGSPPTETHIGMYGNWGAGRWGMVLTGNAQVDKNHLALGRDVLIPESLDDASLQPFKDLADAIHGSPDGTVDPSHRALAIMQVSHSGKQSSNWFTPRFPWHDPPLAPSPVRLGARESGLLPYLFYRFMFSTPREMTIPEIDHLVDRFVLSAQLAHQAGFDGVQLHAGHGCTYTVLPC